MVWNELEWNGIEWRGMTWNEMEWNDLEWYGMEWPETTIVAVSESLSTLFCKPDWQYTIFAPKFTGNQTHALSVFRPLMVPFHLILFIPKFVFQTTTCNNYRNLNKP